MKKLTTLALITASTLSAAAFASNDDNAYDDLQSAKSAVEALSLTLENLGVDTNTEVDLTGAYTAPQKKAVYEDKYAELRQQFNQVHTH
ncbi:hypothetical protein OFY17_01760 [Marinomonas sp. C2222]|uniref:Uncharacterized protein n=1 Tax=Marinomonas sargassi TaxID=2984494 RepID=A0ABT2YNX9_9GAMM|nr:hypothetical protein [Marinomonas sargassi]MCV2401598.1 hypothetical protein [Marinomonas sargassi]